MNRSPRLAQIPERRPYHSHHTESDIAIVGGGIAGVMTAYYILKHTQHSVSMFEAHQIAQGATGHNAGQVAPYFEKDRDEVVEEYGVTMASDAQHAVFEARDRLLEILDYTNCPVPFHTQLGYAGCSTDQQIEHHLYKKLLREQGKSSFDAIFICDKHPRLEERSNTYPGIFETMTSAQISNHIETNSHDYHALLVCPKAVVNSAALCEYLVQRMISRYQDRLSIYEHTPIALIELYDDGIKCSDSQQILYKSKQVILCTNGFEHFEIVNHAGASINTSLHDAVYGNIGYMSAYCDHNTSYKPVAISYFTKDNSLASDTGYEVYFYFTRRPYDLSGQSYTLISIGGPENMLNQDTYDHTADHPQRAHDQNMNFLQSNYKYINTENTEIFRRHGLMGYTKTGLRLIGPHPYNSRFWLNLGCNGVGILTSIYGAHKISRMMAGDVFDPSVFDVHHSI